MTCKTGTRNSSQQHYSEENMLRIQKIYRNLFNNLERDTQGDLRKKELTAFYYYKGRNYNGELLVVGRAVNGWTEKSYRINQLKQQGVIREIFEEIIPPKTIAFQTGCKNAGKIATAKDTIPKGQHFGGQSRAS